MGETWYRGSGYMSEELCQVSPKSHYGVLASHSDPSPCRIATENVNKTLPGLIPSSQSEVGWGIASHNQQFHPFSPLLSDCNAGKPPDEKMDDSWTLFNIHDYPFCIGWPLLIILEGSKQMHNLYFFGSVGY